jgi:hypothetical protein
VESAVDAFVIWIDASGGPLTGEAPLRGRVEHLQTSARAHFADPAELIDFLTRHRRDGGSPEQSP